MDLLPRWRAAMMPTYGVPTLTAVRGEGVMVWDQNGNSYVDMLGGIAVNSLGHAHPAIVAAVNAQLTTLGHVSNLMATEPAIALAERLLGLADLGAGTVFFANSGAEANETALKIARRTGRMEIVAAVGGFHGRTMGALSLTGQPSKREAFEPLLVQVTHVPFGDTAALRRAVTEQTAMVLLEPIQGEAGVVVAPAGYLAAARQITTENGALLALDEVQTGIGRTGAWFAYQHAGIVPDIVTLAKGLGGGLPIGACLAFGSAARLLRPGDHGSTFGGNPVCAAAALAVIETIESEKLCARADELGQLLSGGVLALRHPLIYGMRGTGLLLGIVLTAPVAAALEAELRGRGFLLNAVAPQVLRIAPPLVITRRQVEEFVAALGVGLSVVAAGISPETDYLTR